MTFDEWWMKNRGNRRKESYKLIAKRAWDASREQNRPLGAPPKGVMYKIRNSNGLYSDGGGKPKWSSVGKAWKRAGDCKTRISLANSLGRIPWKEIYTWDVLEITDQCTKIYGSEVFMKMNIKNPPKIEAARIPNIMGII